MRPEQEIRDRITNLQSKLAFNNHEIDKLTSYDKFKGDAWEIEYENTEIENKIEQLQWVLNKS